MEMIIGGAFQGKLAYAKELHPHLEFLDGSSCTWEELAAAKGVYNFQEFIREQMKAGASTQELAQRLIQENPGLVLVSREVGYGVVPVDAFDRAYREAVGRICTQLAAFSHKVSRVVCGIGQVIKDA